MSIISINLLKMRYITYVILFLTLFLFTTCRPDEIVPIRKKATQPILNATISGIITNRNDRTPLEGILIVLQKDTSIVDSIRTPQSGTYQFKIIDTDTFRKYKYSIAIPFTEKMLFDKYDYAITQDSIQIKNFAACPSGFLLLNFVNESLTDSINILHSQMNCIDSEDYKIKIQVTSKNKGLSLSFLSGIFIGSLTATTDTIKMLKMANNAVFDIKGFKNGKMIINRLDTIPIKAGATTNFTYKY